MGIDPCGDWDIDQPVTKDYIYDYITVSICRVVTRILQWFSLWLHPLRRLQLEDEDEDEHGIAKQSSVKAGMSAIPKDVKPLACESWEGWKKG